jgi:hypothetical protein
LFERLKYWWTNRERLKKKLSIQYIRRKSNAFIQRKSLEFVRSYNILNNSLETIREEIGEESDELDLGDELELRLKKSKNNLNQEEPVLTKDM